MGVTAVAGAPVPVGAGDDPATAEFEFEVAVGGDSSSELESSQSFAIAFRDGVLGTGFDFLGGESGGLLAMYFAALFWVFLMAVSIFLVGIGGSLKSVPKLWLMLSAIS